MFTFIAATSSRSITAISVRSPASDPGSCVVPLARRLSSSAIKSSRVLNSLADRLSATVPSTGGAGWLKNSRFWQKSKTVKNSLSFPGPSRSGQRRVPRPMICQNFVFERTSLKNTRFSTSATSMPVKHIDETHGEGETVTDEEIRAAQRRLAQEEGLFVEPSSAAALAGLLKLQARGALRRDETIVLMLTGSGLKATEHVPVQPPISVADYTALSQAVS